MANNPQASTNANFAATAFNQAGIAQVPVVPNIQVTPAGGEDEGGVEGIGPYLKIFHSLDEGASNWRNWTRQITVANDNVDQVSENWEQSVAQVYESIRARPENPTDYEQTMLGDLEGKLTRIEHPVIVCMQLSHLVVQSIVDLHARGDHIRPDQLTSAKPTHLDLNSRAVTRMRNVLKALKQTKRVVMNLLSGADAVTLFVAMPLAYAKVKYNNRRNNRRRDTGA